MLTGRKINFFCGSHLAPKYVKVVANSKKLVAIMRHTQKITFHFDFFTANAFKTRTTFKEDTRMGHIQCERLPKSKMASSDDRFTFEIMRVLHFELGLTRNFAADLSLQIFNNH